MSLARRLLTHALSDIQPFAEIILRTPLYPYQVEPARAICHAVLARAGGEIVVRFPRQSGKNQIISTCQAYLLFLHQRRGGHMIHTAPTYEPQAYNALLRLMTLTAQSPWFRDLRRRDNALMLGESRITFVPGQRSPSPPTGLTASLALFADESQDLDIAYFRRTFEPMRASTNAAAIYSGTARHTGTLLATKRKHIEKIKPENVFLLNWRDCESDNPAYGAHVRQQIAELGPAHPTIVSEYENIETEQSGRLFDQRRIELITASAATRYSLLATSSCVVTIDVGGASLTGSQGEHDSTVAALHIVSRNSQHLSVFTTTDYLTLTGENVLDDTPARARLIEWISQRAPSHIVIDATGIGAGLASVLIQRFGERVTPFVFTASTKTKLLNDFLALIETGRYHHYAGDDPDRARLIEQLRQCEYTQSVSSPGAGGAIQWAVPDHATWHNPYTARTERLHDDHLLAVSLVATLKDAPIADYFPASFTPAPPEPDYRRSKF